jgi:hypothetical protein
LFGVPRTDDAAAELLPVAAGELEFDVEPDPLLHPATVTARHAVTPRAWTGRNLDLAIAYGMDSTF